MKKVMFVILGISVLALSLLFVSHFNDRAPQKPISESAVLPAATYSAKPEVKTQDTPTAVATPIKLVDSVSSETTPAPVVIPNTRQVYPINPLGDLSSLTNEQKQQFRDIYNRFIQTPDLQYMTPAEQSDVFKRIADAYFADLKRSLERQRDQQQQEVNALQDQLNTSNPNTNPIQNNKPAFQPDPAVIDKINSLKQTFQNIENADAPMNIIEGRKTRAYQDWMKNNPDTFSTILGNDYYLNKLNAVLGAYGLPMIEK